MILWVQNSKGTQQEWLVSLHNIGEGPQLDFKASNWSHLGAHSLTCPESNSKLNISYFCRLELIPVLSIKWFYFISLVVELWLHFPSSDGLLWKYINSWFWFGSIGHRREFNLELLLEYQCETLFQNPCLYEYFLVSCPQNQSMRWTIPISGFPSNG